MSYPRGHIGNYHDYHDEGYKRAVVKFVERQYLKQFNIWAAKNEYSKICPDEYFVKMCERNHKDESKYNYIYLTINPPPQYDWSHIMLLMKKLHKLKKLGKLYFTLEQRSLDISKPSGYHVHILGYNKYSKTPKNLAKEAHALCLSGKDPIMPDITINSFNYSHSDDGPIKYLNGQKEKSKLPLVDVDRKLRTNLGYDQTYVWEKD